jgi:hypothetical protein
MHSIPCHIDAPTTSRLLIGLGLLLLGAPACNQASTPKSGNNPAGSILDNPGASTLTSKQFIVEANKAGKAPELHLEGLFWGRLVDIYDLADDGTRTLQQKEFVIGSNIVSDGHDRLLTTNPLTGVDELTILHPYGSDVYKDIFLDLDGDLFPVDDAPLGEVGVFTMLPRNAALVIVFDDLIEPGLVSAQTFKILTGSPPAVPYSPRVIVDTNHGDLAKDTGDAVPQFYSTRVIVDMTISEFESFSADPPLGINGAGLPASTSPNLANLVLRIPTVEKPGIGQEVVVRNLSGHKVATSGNGTVDFASQTVDVLRAMRSGGNTLVTSDPFNGYLRDETPPSVVSVQPIVLASAPVPDPDGEETDFILPQVQFITPDCARNPAIGDLIRQTTNFAVVREVSAPQSGGIASDVKVRLLLGSPSEFSTTGVGPAQYLFPFDAAFDTTRPQCFVQISPESGDFPADPTSNISTSSIFSLRFTEAMDPESMRAFDSMLLLRAPEVSSSSDYVVSQIQSSVDLKGYSILPELPLAHETGTSESYYLSLVTGELGASDLAGNALEDSLPQVLLTVDPTLATQANGGRVTRFSSIDEEEPIGDDITGELPEWEGQHTYDVLRQSIRPRSVVRFEAVVDRNQAMILPMGNVANGIGEPLTKYGNKIQAVWRNCDVNYQVIDTTTYNVDVEGISWVPLGGLAIADHFDQFEIRMAHSLYLPDESINPMTGLPNYPESGLAKIFDTNMVSPEIDPLKIVYSREFGYTISPGDIYAASTGTLMLPFPMNRSLPVSQFVYYTWRDTGLLARGAPNGGGSEVVYYAAILSGGGGAPLPIMSADRVESVGLPLLMEFRCYPDDKAQGMNIFDVAMAVTVSTRPAFRAFSSGGVDGGGGIVDRDPDLESEANGGFNPNSNPPGQATPGQDPIVYLGLMDLVTRVSRSYSVWFQTPGTANPIFQPPIIEPGFDEQPSGTSIELAFRGATQAEPAEVREDANALDGYGDDYAAPGNSRDNPNPQINFLDGDATWHTNVSEIDGALYYQVRVTFLSSTETGVSPELSGIGLTWLEQ